MSYLTYNCAQTPDQPTIPIPNPSTGDRVGVLNENTVKKEWPARARGPPSRARIYQGTGSSITTRLMWTPDPLISNKCFAWRDGKGSETPENCKAGASMGRCHKPYKGFLWWQEHCPTSCNVSAAACDTYTLPLSVRMPRANRVDQEWANRPTRLDPHGCYEARLRAAIERVPGCLARYSFRKTTAHAPEQLPVYVVHAPFLMERGANMRRQLRALQVADVTFVHCINKQEVAAFSAEDRECLHPCYAVSAWTWVDDNRQLKSLHNGTLSLALKHKLVYFDVLRRQLHAALVLEDDAIVPPSLWSRLQSSTWPPDASLVYLGSYGGFTGLSSHPPYPPHQADNRTLLMRGCRSLGCVMERMPLHLPLHRRDLTQSPKLIGAIGYIVFRRGAAQLHQPVMVPADLGISLSVHPRPFTEAGAFTEADDRYADVYEPGRLIRANETKLLSAYLELGAMNDMQCLADGRPVRLIVPDDQYGLAWWAITPNKSAGSGLHLQ